MVALAPSEAVAGKKLLIKSSTPSLATAASEVAIDGDGNVVVPITAKLPGNAYFTLTLDCTDLSTRIIVDIKLLSNVETTVRAARPTANPPSGTVARGTAVTLSTVTKGAMIHFTTDGAEPSV